MQPRQPSLAEYEELRHYVPHGHAAHRAAAHAQRASSFALLLRLARAAVRRFRRQHAR